MLRSVSAINRRLIIAAMAAMVLSLAPAPSHAGCSNSVTMYSASWCPYCKQVRDILARNQIRYTILDATTPDVRAAMLERFGDTAVPRTVIGGVVVEGVDEDAHQGAMSQTKSGHASAHRHHAAGFSSVGT